MRILLIDTDDWAGIYVEGELMDEAHSFEPDLLVAYVLLLGTKANEFRALSYDDDNSIIASYGDERGRLARLPPRFLDGEFDELFEAGEFYYLTFVEDHLKKNGLL